MTPMIVKWLLMLPLSLATKPFGLVTYPFVCLFCSEEGWLPGILSWWQTPDNSMDGDEGFATLHAPFKGSVSGYKRWVNRVAWGYRNSMYGLKINVLGYHLEEGFDLNYRGSVWKPSDRPVTEGWSLRIATNPSGAKAYHFVCFYRIHKKYCLDFMSGWKLWETPVPDHKQYAFRLRVVRRSES